MGDDRTIRIIRRRTRVKRPCQWAPKSTFRLDLIWAGQVLECWYIPGRGYVPSRLLTDSAVQRLIREFPRIEDLRMKKRQIGQVAAASQFSHLAAMESTVFGKLENLVQHCGVTKYDDGDPRQPGWFTVKTMGSSWVVQVKDPDSCAQMQAVAATLDDALALADLLLGGEQAPWEPDPWARKKVAGNSKK